MTSSVKDKHINSSLISPYVDFWMLGGLSILMWIALSSLESFRGVDVINRHFLNLATMSATLSLACNYPHFMASYRLAYSKGAPFITKNWIPLLLIPAMLILSMFLAYHSYSIHGFKTMDLLINIMYFTVGWHYSGQVFGCTMVYSHYTGYKINRPQRNLIKTSIYSVWAISAINAQVNTKSSALFMNIPYSKHNLSSAYLSLSYLFLLATVISVLYFVVWKNYRENKQLPSPNTWIAYVAFLIWWVPVFFHKTFYYSLVPFFHCLQYLPFVYRIEKGPTEGRTPFYTHTRATLIILSLVGFGYLSFELFPSALDAGLDTNALIGVPFFYACAHIFINVHHYFIDSVIWKFQDNDLKRYLLN